MSPQNLSDMMGEAQTVTFHGVCSDCHCDVSVLAERIYETEIKITDGAMFRSPSKWNTDNAMLCKCERCHERKPTWGRPTQIYCRTVGYYAPVSQMNDAKQAEFKLRKNYNVPE